MELNEEDTTPPDPREDARFGRQLTPGTYDCEVLDSVERFSSGGKPQVKLELLVLAPADKAPEGAVKIDYYCTGGTFSMRNLLETFEPQKLGGKKINIDAASYIGKRLKVTTKWEGERPRPDGSGVYNAKAAVVKILGPVTAAAPKADDAF